MARIAIITCSNMTNDMACTSFACLEDSHAGKGTFARYADRGGAQVVGIISCAGCPTLLAPEKIVRRVQTLVSSGVDAVHFANCLEMICPFRKKYQSLLESEFPETEFVSGTHEPLSEEHKTELAKFVHDGLCRRRPSMADVVEKRNSREPGE
ncbi:MAG: CGGC domain-containing protein [Deltaproteobacteria bacterium]|nr:CGGC domain-containing protein [Deltaproteobacteria bacterium]